LGDARHEWVKTFGHKIRFGYENIHELIVGITVQDTKICPGLEEEEIYGSGTLPYNLPFSFPFPFLPSRYMRWILAENVIVTGTETKFNTNIFLWR